MKEVIIVNFSTQKEGVIFETNIPAKLKTGNVENVRTWVSWDKIGEALFEDYTKRNSVDSMKELRGEKDSTS